MVNWWRGCAVAVWVVVVLAAGLALGSGAGVSAQPGLAGETAVRDRLIADQENLLNAYRCMFGVDTEIVPGGCPNPDTVSPGPAPPNPTRQDVEARDTLIANQETLLNTYRCRYDIDTQLVPGGCQSNGTETPTATPTEEVPWFPSDREFISGQLDLSEFALNCGMTLSVRMCPDPELHATYIEMSEALHGCRIAPRALSCADMNPIAWTDHLNALYCPDRPEYGINFGDLWCYPASHYEAWNRLEPFQEPVYPDLLVRAAELRARWQAAE